MKIKDSLFIFLTVVLMILFAASILENISISRPAVDKIPAVQFQQKSASEILARLEEAGLKPREAKYYKVFHE